MFLELRISYEKCSALFTEHFIECFRGRHTGGGQFYFIFAVPFFRAAKRAFSTLRLAPLWREPREAPLEIVESLFCGCETIPQISLQISCEEKIINELWQENMLEQLNNSVTPQSFASSLNDDMLLAPGEWSLNLHISMKVTTLLSRCCLPLDHMLPPRVHEFHLLQNDYRPTEIIVDKTITYLICALDELFNVFCVCTKREQNF